LKEANVRQQLDLRSFFDHVPNKDVPMSTAVVLSARFPYVTPAAHYLQAGGSGLQSRRLVDGGYFDNTGVETWLDLIRFLESIVKEERLADKYNFAGVRFILLSISAMAAEPSNSAPQGLAELMSPIRTMLASWRSRSEITFRKARLELGGDFRRFIIDP